MGELVYQNLCVLYRRKLDVWMAPGVGDISRCRLSRSGDLSHKIFKLFSSIYNYAKDTNSKAFDPVFYPLNWRRT
jgi:hypothetical protein